MDESRYRIEKELGRGGMARVYLAHDVRHNRPVALKLLEPELGAAIGAERFHREIQVIARLRHPHIVPLYDSGEMSGQLYYVMPFVKGETIRERIARSGPFAADEIVRLLSEVADALGYAHSNGVVHRDIKPDNIMIDERHALVMDFGIARAFADDKLDTLTGAGLLIGTPAYMSPEQVTGEPAIDGRTDIYSLGCVAYEMISGSPPFTGRNAQAVMARRFQSGSLTFDPISSAPLELQRIVTKSMKLDVADRYQNAQEMLDDLERARTLTPSGSSVPLPRLHDTPKKHSRRSLVALTVLVIGVIGAAIWKAAVSARDTGAVEANIASIGVLPFTNQTGDRQMDYFSDGLTDELISTLSHVRGLQVAGRASSFAVKNKGLDARQAASKLNVAYLVDAGVRSGGSRVRVTWQLIDGKTGNGLSSGDIDGDSKDVIALQDSMAKEIVAGLEPAIGRVATVGTGLHRTSNYEAHDLYLKGHFYWNQRTGPTMHQGIEYLKEAIAADSTYALAWAELSSAYTLAASFGNMRPSETMQPARDAASKAIALDPTLAEANTAMGMSLTFNDWRPAAALPYLEKAIALDPQNAFPRLFRTWPLIMLGRLDEAFAEISRARALDPLSPILNARLGTVLIYQHRYDDAATELKKVIAADPSNLFARFELGAALTAAGRNSEALLAFPNAIDTESGIGAADHAWAFYRAGMMDSARVLLSALIDRSKQRYVTPVALAVASGAAGNNTLAIQYLDQAIREHSLNLAFIGVMAEFEPLQNDARFKRQVELVKKNFLQ